MNFDQPEENHNQKKRFQNSQEMALEQSLAIKNDHW